MFIVVLGAIQLSTARAQSDLKSQVKAAFLFKFAYFVDWPAAAFNDPAAPLVIGILGEDFFGDALEKMVRGKKVKGRQVEIRRFSEYEEVGVCHILFIGSGMKDSLKETLKQLDGTNILTVGEHKRFARAGGMIQFVMRDGMVRFAIQPEAARRAGLRLGAKLLKLAEIVKE